MAIVYSSYSPFDTLCSVWKCDQPDDYYLDRLKLFDEEMAEMQGLKSKKKSEWLASRYLLSKISESNGVFPCIKDEYGKPHLSGSHWMISLSHTGGFVAAVRSFKPCGVDIQVITQKIERIAPRFISPIEKAMILPGKALQYHHCLWSAKEAIYKAYGRKSLDFIGHIKIAPFIFRETGCWLTGSVQKEEICKNYTLFCRQIENTILAHAVEI